MQEVFEKIKERVCEFIHVRNKSGSAPCKNQRASCLQLIRVCDLTAIINQVAEEYKRDLTKVNQEYNQGWIPCSERLPEEKEAIYVYEGSIEPIELIVQIEGAEIPSVAFFVDGEFKHPFESEGYGFAAEVIAWQPLPEPYKGE